MTPNTRTESGGGPFGFITRRRLLKYGLGGAAALLMGGGGGLYALRGRAPNVTGLRVLSPHEYRTLTAIAHVHIPKGGAFEFGAADVDLARRFDEFLADEPAGNVENLKRALVLFEFGPLFYFGRFATFSNLPAEEQLEHWTSWIVSDRLIQRQIALAFRKFLSLVFYDLPQTWEPIGYPGPSYYGMPES